MSARTSSNTPILPAPQAFRHCLADRQEDDLVLARDMKEEAGHGGKPWGFDAAREFRLYLRLGRFDKPTGTWLVLLPTLWGLWLASRGAVPWDILFVFVLGTILMRASGCAINDAFDRDFDAQVRRTRSRPVAAGDLSRKKALAFAGALAFFSFLLALRLRLEAVALSFAGLGLAVFYPLTKRLFSMPQAVLGVAFGFGIPMGFVAATGKLSWEGWWLWGANVFWAMSYDTIYAMMDKEDDKKAGVRSLSLFLGRWDLVGAAAFGMIFLLMLAFLGWRLGLSWPFWGAMMVALGFGLWAVSLARSRLPKDLFRAFSLYAWQGAAVFAGLALSL